MNEFEQWNKVKILTQNRSRQPYYKERQIWWCRIGQNIGKEMNGKNEYFTRPVLILKRVSGELLVCLPLTHTLREDEYNTSFYFEHDLHCVNINQIRSLDSKRLTEKVGTISKPLYIKIMGKLNILLNRK